MEGAYSSVFSLSIQIGILYIISVFQLVTSYCLSPSVPFANSHNGTEDTVYQPGTTLAYKCLAGFIADYKYRICQLDGSWTGTDKVCKLNFTSFFVSLMAAVGVIMIFIMLVSCLVFRRRKRRPHRTIAREDSSSTIAMKDSRTPTPLGSFQNNNKGSPKNGSIPDESYITDDDNPASSLPSPREGPKPSFMDLHNISVYTHPPVYPPPSVTIPENDLSFIPPPPTPIKPDNINSLLNSEPATSEEGGGIFNPGVDEVDGPSFSQPPPTPLKPDNINSLLNSKPATSDEDGGGILNPGVDGADSERSQIEDHFPISRNVFNSATFISQGEGWFHDDASFDSYDHDDEGQIEEERQHRAAMDVAL